MNTAQLIEFSTNHPALVFALFALLALLLGGELRRRISGVAEITPAAATRLMNSKRAITVDIRPDKEFTEGHIVNSLRATAATDTGSLEKYRDRPLIVYCNDGQRSAGMCSKLRKQGFSEVYNLKGGILAWRKAELPLARQG